MCPERPLVHHIRPIANSVSALDFIKLHHAPGCDGMYLTVLDGIVNIDPAALGILGPAQHYAGSDTGEVDVMIAYLPSLSPAEEVPSRLQDVVRFARPSLHIMEWARKFMRGRWPTPEFAGQGGASPWCLTFHKGLGCTWIGCSPCTRRS
jgi:hypothetical protein